MIRKDFGLLRLSSRLVKIVAWTFLLFGVIQGVGIIAGAAGGIPRWMGLFYIILYIGGFFFIYLMTMIADLLLEVWQFLKKERF